MTTHGGEEARHLYFLKDPGDFKVWTSLGTLDVTNLSLNLQILPYQVGRQSCHTGLTEVKPEKIKRAALSVSPNGAFTTQPSSTEPRGVQFSQSALILYDRFGGYS